MVVRDALHDYSLQLLHSGLTGNISIYRPATNAVCSGENISESLGLGLAVTKDDGRTPLGEAVNEVGDVFFETVPEMELVAALVPEKALSDHMQSQRNRAVRFIKGMGFVRIEKGGNFGDVWKSSRDRHDPHGRIDRVWGCTCVTAGTRDGKCVRRRVANIRH